LCYIDFYGDTQITSVDNMPNIELTTLLTFVVPTYNQWTSLLQRKLSYARMHSLCH